MSKESREKVWTNLEEAIEQRSFVFQLDLSRQGIRNIPESIGKLNKVMSCNLSGNDLDETCFPDEFWELSYLQELDLSHNHFRNLPPCICMFIDLKKLNISGNDFEDVQHQAKLITALFPDCTVTY
mmetsp:Transcript_53846/g.109752  ORF Transcript_53846/g.109752 Transcript_53846/m.109752 type:complete len:126 (+) Transcript_53846:276-653(+)